MSAMSMCGAVPGTLSRPTIKVLVTSPNLSDGPVSLLSSFKFSEDSLQCTSCQQRFPSLTEATNHWAQEVRDGRNKDHVNIEPESGNVIRTLDLTPQMLHTMEDRIKSCSVEVKDILNDKQRNDSDDVEDHYDFLPLSTIETTFDGKLDDSVLQAALNKPKVVDRVIKKSENQEQLDTVDLNRLDSESTSELNDMDVDLEDDYKIETEMEFEDASIKTEAELSESENYEDYENEDHVFDMEQSIKNEEKEEEEDGKVYNMITTTTTTTMVIHYLHKLYTTINDEFVCLVCDYRAEKKNTMWKHVKRSHDQDTLDPLALDQKLDCVFCESKNLEIGDLRKHVSIHHPEKGFNKSDHEKSDLESKTKSHFESCKAPSCFYIGSNKFDLLNHKMSTHESVPDYFKKTGRQYNVDLELDCFVCNICDHQADLEDTMRAHIRRKHDPAGMKKTKIKYKCAFCEVKGLGYDGLRKHVKNHHPLVKFRKADYQQSEESAEVKFSCEECSFVGSNFQSLLGHRRSFHSSGDKGKVKILLDRDYVLDNDMYQCLACSYRARIQNTMRVHVERRHGMKSCFLCDLQADDIEVMKEHVREQHGGQETKCDYCARTFFSREGLKKHELYCHIEKVDPDARLLQCDECKFTVYGDAKLRRHKKHAHSSEPINCDQCEHISKNAASARAHTKVVHQGIKKKVKKHGCDLCDFTGTGNQLKTHLAAKHDIGIVVKRFYCDQCEFNSAYSGSVGNHKKWMHLMLKPKQIFKKKYCDYCDRSFTTNQMLQNHIDNKHLGIKQECSQCGYTCTTSQVLKWHMVAKHGEGYPCPHCPYRATQPNQLKEHVKARHENFKLYCDKCSFSTSFKTNLRAHIKKTHTDQS